MSEASYTAVRIEGNLFTADLITRIAAADRELPGNRPEDYHLAVGERLGEAASRKWEYLLGAYRTFKERIDRLPETDPATTETRERWLLRLLDELGFGRLPYQRGGLTVNGRAFPISHRWENVPMHLVGWHMDLDRRAGGGETGRAPQSMLQEFLNASDDHLWGVLANGRVLRILRDSTALVGSAYVEFDLEAIFGGELYSDFVLLFALLHSSRFEPLPREDGTDPTPADCWLERWHTYAIETGIRARDQLRDRVAKALEELGTGFLEANPRLREHIESRRLDISDFHHELLRLVYQLVFLFVIEDRGVLFTPDAPEKARRRYIDFFSTERLRRIARRRFGDRHTDLWRTLVIVLDALGSDDGLPALGLPALGGLYFRAGRPNGETISPDLLRDCALENRRLLEAVRLLADVTDPRGRRHRIDYRHLGAEELGSVYESLLELVPATEPGSRFVLRTVAGNKRKTTGSYYTPTSLIETLLDTTLQPLIERAARSGIPDDLLKITVCDPACGSGHFLVAAARRLARHYATMVCGDDEPTPDHVRAAMRRVVERCVYGVDVNPLAAELAKVSLWLESVEPGRPLAHLDPHIRVGNSLLGTTPALLKDGIPDEAFTPIEGDDRKIVTSLKRQNAKERPGDGHGGQVAFDFAEVVRTGNTDLTHDARKLAALPTRTLTEVRERARRFREYENSPKLRRRKLIADAWCAAFVWRKHADAPEAITTETLRRLEEGADLPGPVAEELDRLVERYQFFHWHLEFPEIFRVEDDDHPDHNPDTGWQGGFTCVLGNPPWEQIELKEQEFFAAQRPEIAEAANAAERKRMIQDLAGSTDESDRALYADYQAELRKSKAWGHLLRVSGRYPLTSSGRLNTYAVFAETGRTIVAPFGRAGMVLPTGIVTDATTAPFFRDLIEQHHLVSVAEFENEEKIFPQVHNQFRFCLLTLTGRREHAEKVALAFRARQVTQIPEKTFAFTPDQLLRVNPNTGTSPVCDSPRDARILLGIHERIPVLWRENPDENPWELTFSQGLFNMATDSGLFRTAEQLLDDGWELVGNVFVKGDRRMLPLYEGKMVHHFDHRFATYEGATQAQLNKGTLPRSTSEHHENPDYVSMPNYWVQEFDTKDEKRSKPKKPKYHLGVSSRLAAKSWDREWLLGWRDMVRSTDERTIIAAAIPQTAVGHKFLLALAPTGGPLLQANLSSFVLDYCVRQKMAGTSLAYFLVKQLPVLPPNEYEKAAPWAPEATLAKWIEPRVLELSYTAWDMAPFALDIGDDGPPFVWDDERRFWLRAELDAAYFHLYGIAREDVDHIMSTFRAFKNNDPDRYARTVKAIGEIYDALGRAIDTGRPYRTVLDPPPGRGPRHPERHH